MAWRFEIKYLVDTRRAVGLRELLRTHLLPAEFAGPHGSYPVFSQYYDGPGLPLYLDKVFGIERRCKVRLRSYGWEFRPGDGSQWFLELKRKENASISKVRLAVPAGGIDPLRPASWEELGEVAAPFVAQHETMLLEPSAAIWYQREPWASASGDLRVTWDELVRALYPGEAMSRSILYDTQRAVVPDRWGIVEVKSAATLPRWWAEAVRRFSLVPESVSKYVNGMNALDLSRRVLATC